MSAKLTQLSNLPSSQPTDEMYIVRPSLGAGGSQAITNNALFGLITQNITDGAVRFQGVVGPPLSAAGQASLYFDSTVNKLFLSENAGAYIRVGNITGPLAPVADNAIVRFDGATGKFIQESAITINDIGALTFPDDVRQTFNPGATVAGLNVGALTGDPSLLINGDLWYDSTGNLLRARINGASVSLSAGMAIGAPVTGGTPGAVLFVGAGPTLAQDSANLFYDDSLNFLGLGTSTPILRLDIVGAVDGGVRLKQGGQLNGTSGAYGNGMIFENTSTIHSFAIGYAVGGNFKIFHLDNLGAITPVATFNSVVLAVNELAFSPSVSGGGPIISVAGPDSNINLVFSPKGTGVNQFTKNLLMNVGTGALDNVIYVGSLASGPVASSFGFVVAGVGSQDSGDGPYFLGRGNTFTTIANQRGSMFFAAGGPIAPGSTEGSISFFTNDPEDLRVRIGRAGSGLPAVAITQSNTGEIGLDVNNPSSSTVAIATFSVNTVPFVVIDSSANSYFGNGITNAAPANYILNATGGAGTNIAGANLDLAGGKGTGNAIPGAVTVRYPLIGASGTTLQSLSTNRFPISTSLYTNITAGNAISNTTTETSVFTGATASAGSTGTIEGGSARAGTMYRLRLYLAFATTGTPTIRFRLKLGGTTIADSGIVTSPNNANGLAFLDMFIPVNAIGASGLVQAQMEGRLTTAVAGAVTPVFFVGATAPTAIDFTPDRGIDLTAEWGTAAAGNILQLLTGNFIDRIR